MRPHGPAELGRPGSLVTRRGADIRISPFASLGVADLALVRAGVFDTGTWPDGVRYQYVKDAEFRIYVLSGLKTVEDVEAFLQAVDLGAKRRRHPEGCVRVRLIRAQLANPFWSEDVDRMRAVISSTRRTHCLCHETGSYADYDRARQEKGLWKTHVRSDMKATA